MIRPMWYRVLHCEDGFKAAALGAWLAGAAVVSAGAMTYSNLATAEKEKDAAMHAADMQKQTAEMQMDAVKESEQLAQTTAQSKLRAAQARKSQTILTRPELEEVNVNQKTALGVA